MTNKSPNPALIRTKLYRPPLPADWVPRPQLLERLHQERQRPLTLISAPAGFGKSTLLSAWLEHCGWRSAWLSLDKGDNDLGTFLSYIVAAIKSLFPEFGTDTQALLNTVSVPPLPVIVGGLSNDLDELNEPIILALDDYHVIHNPAIHDLLTALLKHPPRALHLMLASRHDPPLPINVLRARAAVFEIRSQDLRFSLEETLAFLRQTLDPQIDAAQATLLKQKTEGWVAGLRLAALSSWHTDSEAKLTRLDPNDVYVMEYFANEVLAQQPAALQEFLIKTSILDRLQGALCEAVTQQSDLAAPGRTYLDWLEELNLFVVPLDDQREWFRYHQLFQQLLQHQLERRYSRDEINALHRRASQWFVTHELLEEAVQHAVLADDTATAAQIIAQQRHMLMNQDEWRHLEVLLRALPQHDIEARPELFLAKAWCAYNHYSLLQMPTLIDQAETLIAQLALEPALIRELQGEVEFFRGYQCFWTNDVPGTLLHMPRVLDQIPVEWWHARVLARLFLAAAYHMLGDSSNATATLTAGLDEAQGNGPYRMRTLLATCFIDWLAGNLQRVLDTASQILALGQHQYSQTINWAHYFRGVVHYHRNNLEQAEQELSVVVLDRYQAHMQCLVQSAIALTFTYQAQQRPFAAGTTADLLPNFLYETENTILLPTFHAFRADLALRQERLAEASQWAAQTQPAAQGSMPYSFVQYLVLPKVLLALNTPASREAAAEQLVQLRNLAESHHLVHVLIEVLAMQAVLFETQCDHLAALRVLERAIGLAQPGGFIRLFVDLGSTMQILLRQLHSQGVAPHFIAQILAAFAAPQPIGSAPAPQSLELAYPLTNREFEVLALLAQRLSNKEIAARLFITSHTAKLHTLHIYQKLQVNTRHDAVAKAQSLGLLSNH